VIAALGAPAITSWASLLVLVFALWRVTRGGGGSAVQELSAANRVLEKRNHALGAEVRDLRIENGQLKQRTDFAAALGEYEQRAVAAAEQHEKRAAARAEATLRVLGLIADRLGPDGEK